MKMLALAFFFYALNPNSYALAQDVPSDIPSKEFVRQAWEASGKNDLEKVLSITQKCVDTYDNEAKNQQASLGTFPMPGQEDDYQSLNNVATCLFIKAEALMQNGRSEEAKQIFQKIIDEYKWSQAWDPRGWFWSVAEKSQASIDMLNGKKAEEKPVVVTKEEKKTLPQLHFKGKEDVVDYAKYGRFIGAGTKEYHYEATDPKGLSEAIGEGIYPNTGSVLKDPGYNRVRKEGRLEGSHWDFVHSADLEAAFYKWATAPEPWGVKLFYIGLIFEKAKMYYEALKAYRAIIVHFPNATGRTYWRTPWYPGQAAVAKIRHLVRLHPELNLQFKGAKIQVIKGFDNDIANDIVITSPGILKKKSFMDHVAERLNLNKQRVNLGKIKRSLGQGEVRLVQYENGHWQMLVGGKPYIIKGITYAPTKVGQSPDKGTLVNWMTEDTNHNGKADGPYDSWVDGNLNNIQDVNELVVGDFRLLEELGANTIRFYHQPFEPDKNLLRAMYKEYGIRVILADFLGKYALGSGASWYEGTDYENPQHRSAMMESVRKMVMEYKDEPYVLMWLLGNENNYGVACNADKKPEAYYKFVNEVALMIKSIDPNHPVAMCNGDMLYLDIFAKYCPDVDVYAANAYRGDYGFGSFWEQVFDATGKPAFISEFGCPGYATNLTREEAEKAQADYHLGNWLDIESNSAKSAEGVGNAIGGIVFEWIDEWWKNYEPSNHDRTAGAIGPFPDGYMYEEWFGLCGQGDGKSSPFLRQLRQSYYLYKRLWNQS
ncbi:MAG TPA: glycoside hydrolase family 2 TIM barrel-domain containing protein [Candidatus Omnitrophota bacterium]|nr:glycoside hydrolase family 2 TIM barrel-domain containing protein [Candidatus Omnitrophota bacterium]HPD84646.1 glycoside hydrolase family 2 TIM barrel-domain containing protein [Candidatus Omnitrophota bacterium]HRZ03504.1 glycoside hydrolase family 2 TIM barrel-domain containing protein [Candidatus Omnitrophota bacterium]